MNFKSTRRVLVPALFAALTLGVSPLFADMGMMGHAGLGDKKMTEHLKKELGLTDAQVAEIKALKEAQKEANKSIYIQMEADVANLKVLSNKSGSSDAELAASVDKVRESHKVMRELWIQNNEAVQKVLTPAQQAKMVLHLHECVDGMGKGKMGAKAKAKK